jgi:Leucine-rich repeat (LRR) protein
MPSEYSPHQINYAQFLINTIKNHCATHKLSDRQGSDAEKLTLMLTLLQQKNYLTEYSINLDLLVGNNILTILRLYHLPLAEKFKEKNITFTNSVYPQSVKGAISLYFNTALRVAELENLGTALSSTPVKSLHFAKDVINDDGFIALFKGSNLEANQMHALSSLDLAHNNIGSKSGKVLGELLATTGIEYLNLNGNPIGEIELPIVLHGNPTSKLSHIYLAHCSLTKCTILGWSQIIEDRSHFKAIDLRGNNLSGFLSTICWQISESKSQFSYIALGDGTISKDLVNNLKKMIEKQKKLHTLILETSGIESEHITSLTNVIRNSQLHTLGLSGNKLGDAGVSELAQIKCQSLANLDLSNNNISQARESLISLSQQLTALNLNHNQIGDEIAVDLATEFQTFSLVSIHLAYNHIGNLGAIAWADVIKYSHTLKLLDLSNNEKIDETGIQALKEAVAERKRRNLLPCEIKFDEAPRIVPEINIAQKTQVLESAPIANVGQPDDEFSEITVISTSSRNTQSLANIHIDEDEIIEIPGTIDTNYLIGFINDEQKFRDYLNQAIEKTQDTKELRNLIKSLIPACKNKSDEFRKILLQAYIQIRNKDTRPYFGTLTFITSCFPCSLFANSFTHLSRHSKVKAAEQCINGNVEEQYQKTVNQGLLGKIKRM